MFWGLVLEPGKRYAQTVDNAFHVSMACLEAKQSDNDVTSVILDHHSREFILCSLQRQKFLQCQLDLNFSSGEKIAFLTSGQGKVHLTGYLIEQGDEDDDEDYEIPEDADATLSLSDKLAGKLASTKRKKKQNIPKEDRKKQKLSSAVDDDESDFPTSDMEDDDVEVGTDSDVEDDDSDSGDDDEDVEEEEEDDEDNEDESEEEIKSKATPLKKQGSASSFSNAGSTPFHKNLGRKEKQKGEKTPKSTPVSSQKTVKTPLAGQINGTPGEKSGKKKKNKNKGTDSATDTPAKGKSPVANVSPKAAKQVLAGGVLIEESRIGSGPIAKQGSYVTVYYTGRLKHNNKQFDSVTEGTGFKFRLGGNEVIRGWDIGIPGMKVGGKRIINIPPQMAYGSKGSPPAIPPNSSLVFEVELRNVK